MTRWYKIVGITNKMYENWKDYLRKDIIVFEENGEMQFRIKLTWIEALWMKIQMVRANLNYPCVLKLEKDICEKAKVEA